jgi:hypothetical protein
VTFAHHNELQDTPVTEHGDMPFQVTEDLHCIPMFASAPLGAVPRPITEAIIIVHGARRNAGDYYRIARRLGGAERLVVAPQFLTPRDRDPQDVHLMTWGPEEWKSGLGRVSSFEVLDRLVRNIAGPGRTIERLTIAGHSAGGQLVQRYAAVGKAPDQVHAHLRFIVANPSTYLYFDHQRPHRRGFSPTNQPQVVNRWRYGFSGRLPAYVNESADTYLARYLRRDVVYVIGAQDCDPAAALLEVHPAAAAQGRTRRERAEQYVAYLNHKVGGCPHPLVLVPGIGHDAYALLTSPEARRWLLPGERSSQSAMRCGGQPQEGGRA